MVLSDNPQATWLIFGLVQRLEREDNAMRRRGIDRLA